MLPEGIQCTLETRACHRTGECPLSVTGHRIEGFLIERGHCQILTIKANIMTTRDLL